MVYLESVEHPRLDLDKVNCYPSSIKGVQGFTTGYIPIGIQAEAFNLDNNITGH